MSTLTLSGNFQKIQVHMPGGKSPSSNLFIEILVLQDSSILCFAFIAFVAEHLWQIQGSVWYMPLVLKHCVQNIVSDDNNVVIAREEV